MGAEGGGWWMDRVDAARGRLNSAVHPPSLPVVSPGRLLFQNQMRPLDDIDAMP